MTESQVIALINQWIIANGNNEITADVLRPILLAMVGQPNDVTGDLSDLSTGANTNLVAAINWLNTQMSGITGNYITLHQGNDDPNVTPPSTFSQGDFYLERLLDNTPIQLWQYNIDGWKLVVAGAGDQDNQFIPYKITILKESSGSMAQKVAVQINSFPSFTISEKQIPLFYVRELESDSDSTVVSTSVWGLSYLGKGTYGFGGTIISSGYLLNISPPVAPSQSTVPPDAVQITISGSGTPESILNAQNPPIFINAASDTPTIITTDDGVYWWLGSEGTYGVGGDTAVAGDFQVLPDEVEYVTQEQLDEAVSGSVPLTGTSENNPITGALQFTEQVQNLFHVSDDGIRLYNISFADGGIGMRAADSGTDSSKDLLISPYSISIDSQNIVRSINSQTANTSGAITLTASDIGAASEDYVNDQISAATVNLWDDRGTHSASGGAYPTTGGSGTSGAILKGDTWTISVAGTLPTGQVVEVGDVVRALIDAPGNTQANWAIQQNNIGYTAENSANKQNDLTSSSIKYPTVDAVLGGLSEKFNNPTGTTSQYIRGNGSLATFAAAVRDSVLAGFVVGSDVPITDSNTVRGAFQNAQGQLNAINLLLPRQLKDFYTDVSNVGTTETDLYSYTIPANTLSAVGQKVIFKHSGISNIAGPTKSIWRVRIAGTAVSETVDGGVGIPLILNGVYRSVSEVIRIDTDSIRVTTDFFFGKLGVAGYTITNYVQVDSLNFASTIVIKSTIQTDGASNDLTAKMGNIVWHPAAP